MATSKSNTISSFEVVNPLLSAVSQRSNVNIELKRMNSTRKVNLLFNPSDFQDESDDSDDDDVEEENIDRMIRQSVAVGEEFATDISAFMRARDILVDNKRATKWRESQQYETEKEEIYPLKQTAPLRSFTTSFMSGTDNIKCMAVYAPLLETSSAGYNVSSPLAYSDPLLLQMLVITGNEQGKICVWDALSSALLRTFQLAIAADNKARSQSINCLVVHDPRRAYKAAEEYGGSLSGGSSGHSGSDGQGSNSSDEGTVLVLTAGMDSCITVWDLCSGLPLRVFRDVHKWFIASMVVHYIPPGIFDASDVIFKNNDGAYKSDRMIVISSSFDAIIQAWDLNTGQQLFRVSTAVLLDGVVKKKSSGAIRMSAFNVKASSTTATKSYLLVGTYDKGFALLDIATPFSVMPFTSPFAKPSNVNCIDVFESVVSNGERCILAASGYSNGTTCVWSALDRKLLLTLRGKHTKTVTAVSLVGSSPERQVRERMKIQKRRSQLTFSPVPGDEITASLRVRHRASSLMPALFDDSKIPEIVNNLADFDPNVFMHLPGMLAVTASMDGLVCIWELTTCQLIREFALPIESPVSAILTFCSNIDEDRTALVQSAVASSGGADDPKRKSTLFGCTQYNKTLCIVSSHANGSVNQYDLSCTSNNSFAESHSEWIAAGQMTMERESDNDCPVISDQDLITSDQSGNVIVWDLATRSRRIGFAYEDPCLGNPVVGAATATTSTVPAHIDVAISGVYHYATSVDEYREICQVKEVAAKADYIKASAGVIVVIPSSEGHGMKLFSAADGVCRREYAPCGTITNVRPWFPAQFMKAAASTATAASALPNGKSTPPRADYWFDSRPKLIFSTVDKLIFIMDFLSGEIVRQHSAEALGLPNITRILVMDSVTAAGIYHPTMIVVCNMTTLEIDLTTFEPAFRTFSMAHTEMIFFVYVYVPTPGCEYNSDVSNKKLLISGGIDKSIVVRYYDSGKVIRVLTEPHSAATVAAAVYDPSKTSRGDVYRSPVDMVLFVELITLSADGKVVIWCLHSGAVMKVIEGLHGDVGVRMLQLFVPKSFHKGPFIVTGSEKGTLVLSDLEFPSIVNLIPAAQIFVEFDLDLAAERTEVFAKGDVHWPRIAKLYADFGSIVFRENPKLFAEAVFHARADFLVQFKQPLVEVLPRLGDVTPGKNGLQFAMDNKDLPTLRVLLKYWSECLNTDITTMGEHALTHPSHYLPAETILNVASKFPSEFNIFILSLRLVKACPDVAKTCPVAKLNEKYANLVVTCDLDDVYDLWGKLLGFDTTAEGMAETADAVDYQPVTPMYLPLKSAATMNMIQAYVNASKALRNTDIFHAEIVIVALRHAWDSFGRKKNAALCFQFVWFLCLYCINLYSFETLITARHIELAMAMQVLFFVLVLRYSIFLVIRLVRKVQHEAFLRKCRITKAHTLNVMREYFFGSIWNIQDWSTVILFLVGTIYRMVDQDDGVSSKCIFAVSSFLIFFKGLYFLRPLPSSGPMVTMIIEISWSIRYFLFILALILTGISQSFWLMYTDEDLKAIPSVWYAGYIAALGNYSTDFSGAASPLLTSILLAAFLLFVVVLMLNLLIALMGDVYSRMNESGLAVWRLNQAEILVDMFFDDMTLEAISKASDDQVPYVHVLQYTSDVESHGEEDEREKNNFSSQELSSQLTVMMELTNGLRGEVLSVDANVKQNHSDTQAKIDQMEKKLDQLAASMQNLTDQLVVNK